MKRKVKIIFPIIIFIAIVILIVYSNYQNRFVYNDDMVVGNTPGNLMNGGYFCENGDTIYFSNSNDYQKLYSMNLDCKKFKRIGKTTVSEINCAGKYIYYAANANKYKDKKGSSSGSVLSNGGIGLFRSDKKGNHTQTLYDKAVGQVSLSGNFLYYQHYDKNKGVYLYKTKIDEKLGHEIFKCKVSPVGIHDRALYYCGVEKDHSIFKMSLLDESYEKVYEGNCTHALVFQNKLYFIDMNNNYALTRINMDGTEPTVLEKERVLTYNFSLNGNFLYYQIDNQDKSRICQMDMETGEVTTLLKGNFCNINTTSKYIFFSEYDTDNVYVLKDEKNPKLNMFEPPIIK